MKSYAFTYKLYQKTACLSSKLYEQQRILQKRIDFIVKVNPFSKKQLMFVGYTVALFPFLRSFFRIV